MPRFATTKPPLLPTKLAAPLAALAALPLLAGGAGGQATPATPPTPTPIVVVIQLPSPTVPPATPAATPAPNGEATPAGVTDTASEVRQVSGFDEVSLQGIGTLSITQGETEGLTIEAAPRVLARIATEVEGGRLTIRPDRSFTTRDPIAYRLTVKELSALELAGAARAEADGLVAGELALTVGGNAAVAIADLQADALSVAASGAARVELAGAVDRQEVALDGTGAYLAEDLASREASVRVGGSAEATVRVAETLVAEAAGAGRIAYVGDARVRQETSGAGRIAKIG